MTYAIPQTMVKQLKNRGSFRWDLHTGPEESASIIREFFLLRFRKHDDGVKCFRGRTKNFKGDLIYDINFRQVYAHDLEKWLQADDESCYIKVSPACPSFRPL